MYSQLCHYCCTYRGYVSLWILVGKPFPTPKTQDDHFVFSGQASDMDRDRQQLVRRDLRTLTANRFS